MAINPGFKGIAKLNGYYIRFVDCSVNLEQETEFYDHIIGLRDTIPTDGLTTKGEQTNTITVRPGKVFWRPGVKIIKGSISFPIFSASTVKEFWDLAKKGTSFTFEVYYDCSLYRKYENCKISNFTLSVTAGDILQASIEITGRGPITENATSLTWTDTYRIITWDAMTISCTNVNADPMQSFELSITNPCIPIYTSGKNKTNKFLPYDLRVGIQEVTGHMTFYKKGIAINELNDSTTYNTITFKIGDGSDVNKSIYVVLKPVQRNGSLPLPLHTINFIGIDEALGT